MTALSLTVAVFSMLAKPHSSSTSDPAASMGMGWMSYTWLIGPVIGLIVIGTMVRVFLPLLRGSAQRKQLLATGEQAQAVILGIADTGLKVNDSPQLMFKLEVRPNGRPPYQADCKMIVNYLAIPRIQPGMTVPVRFDPQNPQNVTVEI